MESSSTDNDSLMKVDDAELLEEYDGSVWHDEDCLREFEEPAGTFGSTLCYPCQSLFTGHREEQKVYKHYYRLSALRTAAERGCHLCALVRSKIDRETEHHRPSEAIKLSFEIYQAYQYGETTFELWFHFLRLCKGAKCGDVVWGIKTIDFVLSEDISEAAIGSHEITLNSQSQDNRLLATRWLANCTANHERCNHPRTRQKRMPNRLLDVKSAKPTADKVVLVEGTSMPIDQEYITLSHCWGSKPVISLTQANIESLKRGIPISDLPKTFRDAVIVAGWFQCQYLWIDSLCIIQDCVEDWRKESAEMRHIYKNAQLNIAATSAADSSCGLFFDRDPSLVSTGLLPVSWDGELPKGTFRFFLRHIWAHGVGKAPLNKRAWVVQERFLARRNLHFGSESMFFECHESEACETFPERLPTFFDRRLVNRFKGFYPSMDPNPTARATSFLTSLQKIINAYMECDLTYKSDKMIALSGVAAEFQSLSKDTYLAGLWKNCFFIDQLLWIVRGRKKVSGQPSARPSVYRAPSWSWLSIDAGLSWPVILKPPLIELLDENVELVDPANPTGEVKRGVLSIRGHLKRINLQKHPTKRAGYHAYDEDDNRIGLMTVAFDEAAIRPTRAFCIPVRTRYDDDDIEGLLLVPTGGKPMEFRRVGHFESDDVETYQKLARGKDGAEINLTIV